MSASVPLRSFRTSIVPMNSSSKRANNTNTDVWTSATGDRNSLDLPETISTKETMPMVPVRSSHGQYSLIASDHIKKNNRRSNVIYPTADSTHVEPATWTSLEKKFIGERAIHDIQHLAMVGIIVSILVGVIVIGILTLIFSLQQDVPTGTIFLYSGTSLVLPQQNDHWLFCNGSEISRAAYPSLFAVIGITYGQGNGIDTFNLPDFRARFPLGSSIISDTTLPAGGSLSHTISINELPTHSHGYGSLQTLSAGTHTHNYVDPGHNHGGTTGNGPYGSGSYSMQSSGGYGNDGGVHNHAIPAGQVGITIQSSGSHSHAISGSTGSTGQGQPFSMMPPYQTVNYIIRT